MTPPANADDARTDVNARAPGGFGPNAWLVDDLYERYLADPASVSQGWRRVLQRLPAHDASRGAGGARRCGHHGERHRHGGAEPARHPRWAAAGAGRRRAARRGAARRDEHGGYPRRADGDERPPGPGPAARGQPAAAERAPRADVGAQGQLHAPHRASRSSGRSATCRRSTRPSSSDVDGKGTPGVVHHEHVGLGLAIDVERPGGTRTLVVPVVKDADTLDFAGVRRRLRGPRPQGPRREAHRRRLRRRDRDDHEPRHPRHDAVGPAADVGPGGDHRRRGHRLPGGVRRPPTRVPRATRRRQGRRRSPRPTTTASSRARSPGCSSARRTSCLVGEHGFYDEVFAALGVPIEPARWQRTSPPADEPATRRVVKQAQVQTLINMYRVRGHLIADLDPSTTEPPRSFPELDPLTTGSRVWDLEREFVDRWSRRAASPRRSREILAILRAAYCGTLGDRVHAHPGSRAEAVDPAATSRASGDAQPSKSSATCSSG